MQSMKMSAEGLAQLAYEEGIVLAAYYDSVGVLTCGIGHTIKAGPPDPKEWMAMPASHSRRIQDGLNLFLKDIQRYEKTVNQALTREPEQHQFDAMVSFHYNTGGIARARLTELFNRGEKPAVVGQAFMGWLKPPSLRPRRTREKNLFILGNYMERPIPVWNTNGKGRLGKIVSHYSYSDALHAFSRGGGIPEGGGRTATPDIAENPWPGLLRAILNWLVGR
jgi:lysozyme